MLQKMMTIAAVGCAVLAGSFSARAAEIRVTSSNALKTSLEVLAPGFEMETGHKLVFTWGAGAPLKVAIEKGASFDVAVLTTAAIDDLIKQGKIETPSRTNLVRVGVGVGIRQGAAKPDISTVDAFKRALLNAK